MSDLAKQIAAHTERTKGMVPKTAKQILGGTHKDRNGNMAVYLPRDMIADLKELAHQEGVSVSEIAKELFAERLAAGPRFKETRSRRVIE
ncbi:ParB-like dsDNA partitioning protein [Mycobacterium phage LoneWolf]|uniref:ParB-like dsDNA partitioning protein n=1 Tax=Mycobacterium phage Alma TaxID=2902800 RepID=G8I7Q6_9CAUD|nr:Arc-like repressor [Mycobacterium phage Alma]AER48746.1 ParB-like dsDNA partitioning protein [Mycobacterium phage Alma]QBJ04837.1 ParB-like dsDNA partitioning protein [Mycobacterium phage Elephantoon]QGH78037.1 ParB-like dsDNA partitioning protein [Mycobacterium phage LoneWolf]